MADENTMQAYDYVVVGGGAAGCCVAARLSEDSDVSVLLLEAGGPARHPYIQLPAGFAKLTGKSHSWGYSTVPQAAVGDRALWFPQGRVVGGSTSINAMIYTRGNRADYDGWAAAGCPGWSYDEVLPYFTRSEGNEKFHNEYHGSTGPLGISDPVRPLPISAALLRAAQQAGIPFNPDFNGAEQAGCGYYQVTNRNARRCSAAHAFLDPALARPNLTLRTNALALQLQFDNARATGVRYYHRGSTHSVRAEQEVIVTAGAIGSPKLLMLSGIGDPAELEPHGIKVVADVSEVGRNLQDHLDLYMIYECRGDFSYDRVARPHRAMWALLQYLLFRQGPLASTLIDAGVFWHTGGTNIPPDIQMHFVLGAGVEHGVARLRNPGVTLNTAFLRPRARGTVKLRDGDPRTMPLIDPNYWGDPQDIEKSVLGFRLGREILAQPAMRTFLQAERFPGPDTQSDADIIAYAKRTAKIDYHPVGTCRMGSDEQAVVSPELRVRGVDGLRVADSSVMPCLPSCNTNAPTMMIAEKAAELIRETHATSHVTDESDPSANGYPSPNHSIV